MPNPRSVKFSPLRPERPMPSSAFQRMKSVATPPCMMKSSMRWPTSLSTNAVHTAVFSPKHFCSPRATLYSPPHSHALNSRAVRMRPSPGSSRSMTSPSESSSNVYLSRSLSGMLGFHLFEVGDIPLFRAAFARDLIKRFDLGLAEEQATMLRGQRCGLRFRLAGKQAFLVTVAKDVVYD